MPTGNIEKRDSIRANVFERGGMGVWGKGGENFLQKVFPSLPPIFLSFYPICLGVKEASTGSKSSRGTGLEKT